MVFHFVGWKLRCAQYFPYSTYFEGGQSSAVKTLKHIQKVPLNGGMNHQQADQNAVPLPSNGKLENVEALKDLAI